MKFIAPALIAMLLGASGAYAQTINLGPGGVSVDPRSPRERSVDREIRRDERDRDRRREYRAERRGRGDGCRTVTTTRETPRGQVSRTTRVCD